MRTLGIDIGGTFAKSVILDGDDRPIERHTEAVPDGDLIGFISDLARRRMDDRDVQRVGVGIAGLVDHASGAFV